MEKTETKEEGKVMRKRSEQTKNRLKAPFSEWKKTIIIIFVQCLCSANAA